MGRQSRTAGGGVGVREVEAGRGRKGPLKGRTQGSDRDLGARQGLQRGGQPDKGTDVTCLTQGTPCGHPAREVSTEEWWRPADGGDVQVDGCSAPRRFGGEKRVQRGSKAASKGEIWESNRS